jgi:predicted nuclease of predicted toxin-antitoxin system
MKILVDEHIPLMTVRALRLIGHDVHDIRGTLDEGMQDDALWAMAQFSEREWPGLLVVMRDVAQSTWRARESP